MGFFYIGDAGTDEYSGWGDDVAVMMVGGELDYAASPQLRERIADQITAGGRRLVLDLSAVTFIDSTAIGVLVGAVMRLRETGGGSLAVVCAPEKRRVVQIFEIAAVSRVIELHDSREEALLALAMAG
jgi:anti-sigma B factor antagonist